MITYVPPMDSDIYSACAKLVRLASSGEDAEMSFNGTIVTAWGLPRTTAEREAASNHLVACYFRAREHAETVLAAAESAAIAAHEPSSWSRALTPYEVLLVHGSRRFYASTELASAQSELTAAMRLTDARMLTMSNDEWDAHFGRINAIRARIAELRAKLPAGGQ